MTTTVSEMSAGDLLLGIALVTVGVAAVLWSLLGDTYDDRLEDRSLDRLRSLGWSYSPLQITLTRRVFGAGFGLIITGAGVWWLLSGYGG
jgi:hypothetical protein